MQDFVFNWVATGVVLWTAAFLAARKALPHRSFDFCSRLVSTMHACTAVGLATFSVQDWSCPVCPLGAISSPCQMKILSVTLSYLIYDAVCSLFDKRVDVSNLVHHTVGIVGILAGLAYEMCGSEMVATMWITEISSPFLHLREFLKEVGYKDTDLNLAVDILFAVTFSLARMVCGPYLVTVTLMADYPLLIKRKNQRLNPVTILHTNKRKKQRLNPVTMSGTGKAAMEGEGRRPRGANWDARMDRFLVDLMIKEMHRKNYPSGNFNTHSWTSLTTAFNAGMGHSYTRDQVKDHWRNLRKKFVLYEELLKLSGWGWDLEHKIPIPGYEGAWEEVVKVNAQFSQIKRRPFPLYDDCLLLCKNSMATGELAEGMSRRGGRSIIPNSTPYTGDDHINDFCNAIPTVPHVAEHEFEPAFSLGDTQDMNISSDQPHTSTTPPFHNPTTSRVGSMSCDSPKRKHADNARKSRSSKKIGQATVERMNDLTQQRNEIMANVFGGSSAVQQQQSAGTRGPLVENIPTINECIQDLKDIPTLPRTIFMKAIKLVADPNTRLLLSALSTEDKVDWLTHLTADS